MTYYVSQSAELAAGINHAVNPGKANTNSLTLGSAASSADQGLADTAARSHGLTPRAVLSSTVGGSSPDDGSWEAYQRQQGGYQAGSLPELTDQLGQGSDSVD